MVLIVEEFPQKSILIGAIHHNNSLNVPDFPATTNSIIFQSYHFALIAVQVQIDCSLKYLPGFFT